MRKTLAAALTIAVLAGCGRTDREAASPPQAGAASAPTEALAMREVATSSDTAPPAAPIPVSQPKIAYVYGFGYRLSADRIPALQRRHADLCEKLGSQQCRIIDMRQSGEEAGYATGSLTLAVAARRARAFGVELAKAAQNEGGKEVSTAITGEDLSKQIVDTEARLRARTLLRDRLMEVLATRKGSVAELVEAERGVAQVNEEIDQARAWLAEMNGRVDFSRVEISYASGTPTSGGFLAPIRAVVGNLGSILGTLVAGIIVLLAVAIPLGGLAWALRHLWLRIRRRGPAEEG